MSQPGESQPLAKDPMLPPVEPPSAGFLLQLFLIPMIIVMIIVMVWLMFSWLAHMGNDPTDLVRGLKKKRWQDAATLADLLRDPQKEFLRHDAELAAELSTVLGDLNAVQDPDDEEIKIKIFLCKALGEFRISDGLPVLVEAAKTEHVPEDVEVRQYAVQAIAVLANNLGSQAIREQPDVLPTLISASQEREETMDPANRRANLRTSAAFALGVLGGDEALQRLALMSNDPFPNVRYNAATGLARHGDPRAISGLLAMLDPENDNAVSGEDEENQEWKRIVVLINGIRASEQLAQKTTENLGQLKASVERLNQDGSPRAVRVAAQEAIARWPGR